MGNLYITFKRLSCFFMNVTIYVTVLMPTISVPYIIIMYALRLICMDIFMMLLITSRLSLLKKNFYAYGNDVNNVIINIFYFI